MVVLKEKLRNKKTLFKEQEKGTEKVSRLRMFPIEDIFSKRSINYYDTNIAFTQSSSGVRDDPIMVVIHYLGKSNTM